VASSPILIGIAGPSGAGKTALARGLVRRLGRGEAIRVSLDSFYRDLSDLTPRQRSRYDFDAPGAIDRSRLVRDLRNLARGEAIRVPVYRFDTHTRAGRERRLAPARVVVVEGLFALSWKPVRDLLDLKVFVEAPRATCLERRLARDTTERGRTAGSVRRQFGTTVWPSYERRVRRARRHAELLLDGTLSLDVLLRRILGRLEQHVRP